MNDPTKVNISNLLINYYEVDNIDSLNLFFLYNKDFAFRTAFYLFNNIAFAENVVKQAYFNILKRITICSTSVIHDEEKVKSWLINNLLQVARDVLKKENFKTNKAVHQKNISHKVNLKQTLILEELQQLPEKLKLPLLLHYRERISILEISHIYQTNQTQIKNNIQSALDQLKLLLKNSGMILTGDLISREIQIIKLPECSQEFAEQINFDYLSKLNFSTPNSTQSNLEYIQWLTISAIVIPLLLGLFYFLDGVSNNQNEPTPAPVVEPKKAPEPIVLLEKISWDFSKENEQGLTIIKGHWNHDPIHGFMKTNFNTTTLIKTPFEFKNNSAPTIININSLIFNPFINREISSRLCGYLIYGNKTVKYKFTSHITQLNKNKTKLLGGFAIDYPVKLIVHQKGIFVIDKENKIISTMLFTEPLPVTSKIVLGFDNIYTKSISFEPNAVLSNEIESKIKEFTPEPILPTDTNNTK